MVVSKTNFVSWDERAMIVDCIISRLGSYQGNSCWIIQAREGADTSDQPSQEIYKSSKHHSGSESVEIVYEGGHQTEGNPDIESNSSEKVYRVEICIMASD